jgi:hypothetical protein
MSTNQVQILKGGTMLEVVDVRELALDLVIYSLGLIVITAAVVLAHTKGKEREKKKPLKHRGLGQQEKKR